MRSTEKATAANRVAAVRRAEAQLQTVAVAMAHATQYVPKNHFDAPATFKCQAYDRFLTGEKCASAWADANLPDGERLGVEVCVGCPAGERRAELLLGVSDKSKPIVRRVRRPEIQMPKPKEAARLEVAVAPALVPEPVPEPVEVNAFPTATAAPIETPDDCPRCGCTLEGAAPCEGCGREGSTTTASTTTACPCGAPLPHHLAAEAGQWGSHHCSCARVYGMVGGVLVLRGEPAPTPPNLFADLGQEPRPESLTERLNREQRERESAPVAASQPICPRCKRSAAEVDPYCAKCIDCARTHCKRSGGGKVTRAELEAWCAAHPSIYDPEFQERVRAEQAETRAKWQQQLLAAGLGVDDDATVAARVGRSTARMRQVRQEMGIPTPTVARVPLRHQNRVAVAEALGTLAETGAGLAVADEPVAQDAAPITPALPAEQPAPHIEGAMLNFSGLRWTKAEITRGEWQPEDLPDSFGADRQATPEPNDATPVAHDPVEVPQAAPPGAVRIEVRVVGADEVAATLDRILAKLRARSCPRYGDGGLMVAAVERVQLARWKQREIGYPSFHHYLAEERETEASSVWTRGQLLVAHEGQR